jgi:hypothetical protein
LTPLKNIDSRISPQIFEEKKKAVLLGYSEAQGKLIHKKKLKLKILCQTSFNLLTVKAK